MNRNRVTVRYARALIELANEQNVLDVVSKDIAIMLASLSQYQGFTDFVLNPAYTSKHKFDKVESIFSKEFHALTMKFLKLVFDNNREEYLKDLCRNIVDMAKQMKGIVTANLTTAAQLDAQLIKQLRSKFEEKINATLEMTNHVNPELIGGFIFTIDGQQYDASVASKLNAIKKQLQLK